MINFIYKIFIIFCLLLVQESLVFADINKYNQVKNGHLVDIDMTLFYIDNIFKDHNVIYLNNISLTSFQKKTFYLTLKNYMQHLSINLNHIEEICNKAFILNNNEKSILNITFIKMKKVDRRTNELYSNWYIEDACIINNGTTVELHERGLSSKSFVRNFEDFLTILKNNKIEHYLGLAKYGKLNKLFLKKNTIDLSLKSNLIVKNVIIHKNGIIQDLIFLKFKYFSMGYKENGVHKSGWLLVDANSMSHLYKIGNNLYIDYLLGRLKSSENLEKLKLNQPNDIQNLYLQPIN